MQPERFNVAVVGGGPAGLAAAYKLAGAGARVDVYERGPELGGMARSVALWGETIDLGPHVVAGGDPEALALWSAIVGPIRELPLRRALLRRGRLIDYPPTPTGLLRSLRMGDLITAAHGYLGARLGRSKETTPSARQWFVSRYGRGLYNAVLKSYIEKLWGCDGSLIDATYLSTVASAAAGHSSATSRVVRYPADGLGAVWRRLTEQIHPGARFLLNSSVESLCMQQGRISGLRSAGQERVYDAILSTLPLRALLAMLPSVPREVQASAERLRTRNVLIVYLRVQSSTALRHAWVLIDHARLRVGRVSDSRFWRGDTSRRQGVITMEYWCDDTEALWLETDASIDTLARHELGECGLLRNVGVEECRVVRIRGALPVPRVGYREEVSRIEDFVRSVPGLDVMGRHGSFVFDSTLSSMADGLAAAQRTLEYLESISPALPFAALSHLPLSSVCPGTVVA